MAKVKLPVAVGFFDDPEHLLEAAQKARERGFANLDAYTPYNVHGLDQVLGLKPSWVPYATLAAGLSGATLGMYFMYWTSAVDWPLIVGGKPFFSWPAFVPITFECGILLGGLTTLVALFKACGIPTRRPVVFDPRLTDDRLALVIPLAQSTVHEDPIAFLKGVGASDVRRIVA